MQQGAILEKTNKLKKIVLAHKYMTTDKGLIFIVFTKTINKQPGKTLNVVKTTTDEIFLESGDIYIYMSLTSAIIRHLKRIMHNQKNITIALAENTPVDNEIKIKFSITLGRVDCATIISLYQISTSGTEIEI